MKKRCVLAISSRSLFDLDESHHIFETQGFEAFAAYQRAHEDEVLAPGAAFGLVNKFLALNEAQSDPLVEIMLLSRNTADTGLRIFNSIEHYALDITRAAFTGGASPYPYASDFGADLLLSLNVEDVRAATLSGFAAATIYHPIEASDPKKELRIAFDGDAVLFSDDSERVHQEKGLDAFHANEAAHAKEPLPPGPFKRFVLALQMLQEQVPGKIRTALVTARSAPAHARVIHTLRAWDIRLDEALFLGGMEKTEFLNTFGADIFFDDQRANCGAARQKVTTAHVPYGITND